jgi:hypothetical protein
MKKVAVILAVVVTLLALGTGAAYAAQDSLPGETLYPVKLGTEQVMMLLSRDEVVKAERALSFTERRMGEIEALVAEGLVQDLDLAVEKYGYALNMALATMERAHNHGLATQNITARVAEAAARHLSILDTVYDMVPDEGKAAIANARQISEMGREDALAALAGNDTMHAAEMNLAAMEGRLNRSKVQAGFGDADEVENALQQFEDMARFSQEIYQIAEETGLNITELAGIVTAATSMHLEVLAELYEEVPEEAKWAVERAMEESFEGYDTIIRALKGIDVDDAQLPVIPEMTRKRMEDILGWTNAPKARIPTGGSPGYSCPYCRY